MLCLQNNVKWKWGGGKKTKERYEIKLTAEVAISCDINFRQNRRKGCELAIRQ